MFVPAKISIFMESYVAAQPPISKHKRVDFCMARRKREKFGPRTIPPAEISSDLSSLLLKTNLILNESMQRSPKSHC
jgi:hypothetical protein